MSIPESEKQQIIDEFQQTDEELKNLDFGFQQKYKKFQADLYQKTLEALSKMQGFSLSIEIEKRNLDGVNANIDHVQKQIESLQSEIAKIIAPLDVWCADLKTDLTAGNEVPAIYLHDSLSDYPPIILPQKYSLKPTETAFWQDQIDRRQSRIDAYQAQINKNDEEIVLLQNDIEKLTNEKTELVNQLVIARANQLEKWVIDGLQQKINALDNSLKQKTGAINHKRSRNRMIEVYKSHIGFDKLKAEAIYASLPNDTILHWLNKTQIEPTANQKAQAVVLNEMLLPAHQKWWPTYRAATATAVYDGNDTMDVTLWPAYSPPTKATHKLLEINQVEALSAVPVVYMNCHAKAFDPGDQVLVDFQGSWETPRVIGFVSSPKACPVIPGDECISVFIYPDFEFDHFYNSPSRLRWYNKNAQYGNPADMLIVDWDLAGVEGRPGEISRTFSHEFNGFLYYRIYGYRYFSGNNNAVGYIVLPQTLEGHDRIRVHQYLCFYTLIVPPTGEPYANFLDSQMVQGSLVVDYAVDEVPMPLTARYGQQSYHSAYRGIRWTGSYTEQILVCCNYPAARCDFEVRNQIDDAGHCV